MYPPRRRPWPPFGMLRARRFFEKGAIRFVVLDFLAKKPAHGYEIIRALESRFHGLYTPARQHLSTLQLLQDQGYVTSEESGGKKIYTVTEAGHRYLADNSDIVEGLDRFTTPPPGRAWLREEFHDTVEEARRVGRLFMHRAPGLSRQQIDGIRNVVGRAVREIEDIIESQP